MRRPLVILILAGLGVLGFLYLTHPGGWAAAKSATAEAISAPPTASTEQNPPATATSTPPTTKAADPEAELPMYRLASIEEAKASARARHWPLAWMCGHHEAIEETDPEPDSEGDLTQMALSYLKSRAVVVFLDGNDDLFRAGPVLLQQFFQFDDGIIPTGHHFYAPKIVFSDPDVTKAPVRVWCTELKAKRESALADALKAIAAGGMTLPAPAPH